MLHQPGGASPPLLAGTVLLALSGEVYEVASVRLVLPRFQRWWIKRGQTVSQDPE